MGVKSVCSGLERGFGWLVGGADVRVSIVRRDRVNDGSPRQPCGNRRRVPTPPPGPRVSTHAPAAPVPAATACVLGGTGNPFHAMCRLSAFANEAALAWNFGFMGFWHTAPADNAVVCYHSAAAPADDALHAGLRQQVQKSKSIIVARQLHLDRWFRWRWRES
jgi:hypothetical protein